MNLAFAIQNDFYVQCQSFCSLIQLCISRKFKGIVQKPSCRTSITVTLHQWFLRRFFYQVFNPNWQVMCPRLLLERDSSLFLPVGSCMALKLCLVSINLPIILSWFCSILRDVWFLSSKKYANPQSTYLHKLVNYTGIRKVTKYVVQE